MGKIGGIGPEGRKEGEGSSSSSSKDCPVVVQEKEKEECDDEVNEVAPIVTIKDPGQPTAEELETHNVTHLPHRAWCPICVKNAAQNNPHKKVIHVRETEMFGMDYMYMSSKPTGEEIAHPI